MGERQYFFSADVREKIMVPNMKDEQKQRTISHGAINIANQ